MTHVRASMPRPGALTALIEDLARAPEGPGWEQPLTPGDHVGRFEIGRELGRGGFGVVYEARDLELGRAVAFKAIRSSGERAARETRLLAEAEAAARLSHPNIVHLYDLGRAEQGPFLIMELLRGRTLARRLADGALPAREAVRVAVEVARGMAHAHGQGVVHRDLKPGNVLLCDDGQVKVLDFGLAHVFGKGGVAGGTPAYMPPEQGRGEPGDARSDVYALGVLIAEMLTGSPAEVDALPGAPAALTKLVARMRAAAPAERPADGAEAHAALLEIQKGMEPRRRLWAAWGVAALALAIAVAFGLRSRPLPPGRLVAVMTDTENTTGDADLDAVSDLIRPALDQSRRVSLVARSRVVTALREAGRNVPRVLGEQDVRAAAPARAAQVLLVPAVRRVATDLDLSIRAVDLASGALLFTARERAVAKGTVPEALDRLVARVRAGLQEPPTDAPVSYRTVAQAAPAQPEAWRHYAEGQRLASEGRGVEASAAYERAIAADPDFPLAHAELALFAEFFDEAAVKRHLEAALRGLDRVPPKERALVEGTAALVTWNFERALERYDEVIAGWPDAPEAYQAAARLTMERFGDVHLARPYLERLLALGALGPRDRVWALLRTGRLDEALEVARRWVDGGGGAPALAWLGAIHRMRGESPQALDAARRALALAGPSRIGPLLTFTFVEADALEELLRVVPRDWWGWPGALALQGRRREAHAAVEAIPPPPADAPRYAHGQYHMVRADWFAAERDVEGFWREVQSEIAVGFAAAACATTQLAWLGDLDRAERLDGLWPMIDARLACPRMYRILSTWRGGDVEGALAASKGFEFAVFGYHRGEMLLDAGRLREAVEEFRRWRRDPVVFDGELEALFFWPTSLVLEAGALERLGERDEALRVVERFLALWRDADRDLPLLSEARALRGRLTGLRGAAATQGR